MATPTNDDVLGKPIEAVTRVPVKRASTDASNKALVAGAEQLAQLGLQADQAFSKSKLRGEIGTTLQAYERVQGYATGETDNLFTGDTDVDQSIRSMVGEMDDVREAVRQGVLLPELGKARLETVLKNAKARRPNYADQLNAVASDVLGFNPSGFAERKLFTADSDPKLSPAAKLRQKMYEDAAMYLYGRGMGPSSLELPVDTTIRTASKLKEVEAKQEQLLTDFRITEAEDTQVDKWTTRIANTWGTNVIDQQLAGFSARLASAPTDPTARAEWMRTNVPNAITNLQALKNNLSRSFVEQVRILHGDEGAARLDSTKVAASLKPVTDRIDQMIADFQDPTMLDTYTNALELDMTGLRTKFLEKPNARRYLSLFSSDGRDAALLNTSVLGTLSKQQAGTRLAREFSTWMGLPDPQASVEERKTAEAANYAFVDIAGAETPEQAQEAFFNLVEEGNQPWFDKDINSPTTQVQASNAFAIRSLGNIEAINKGQIPAENATQALLSTKNAIQGMLTIPAQNQVVELPSTASLYSKLNGPEVRQAEAQYGVSFDEERSILQERLRTNVDDRRGFYSNSISGNQKIITSPTSSEKVEVRPLTYTNFVFDTKAGQIVASPDRKAIEKRIGTLGVFSRGSTAGNVRDAYMAPSQAFNNDTAAYQNGVSSLFFAKYNEIKEREGSVDLSNDTIVNELAGTGVIKDLGYVSSEFEMEVADWRRAMINDPTIEPDETSSRAMQLAYEWRRTPSIIGQPTAGMSIEQQASALTQLYSAAWMKQLVKDGRFKFN